MRKRAKKRRSPMFYLLWGGFNAGSVFGLLDALIILVFGLGTYNKFGAIFGLIAVDSIGMGIAGMVSVTIGFTLMPFVGDWFQKIRKVLSGVILIAVFGVCSFWNLNWTLREVKDSAPEKSANFLLVTIDTLRADMVGAGGNSIVRSPCFDRLAQSGWQFMNAICTVPMTTPSHASMMTSTIPAVHGAKENRYRLGPDNESLAEILHNHGYRTAAFVSCFPLDRRFGLDQGFMLYEDTFPVPGDLRQASWLKMCLALKNRNQRERSARITNSLALPWVTKYAKSSPFFLWVHYFDPHAPYVPPLEEQKYYAEAAVVKRDFTDEGDFQKARSAVPDLSTVEPGIAERRYLGEVSESDRQMQRLIWALAERSVLSNTLICAVADHGESFGEHGFFYTHGEDIYEPALAIPMVFAGYGINSQNVYPHLTSTTDIAPSVLSILGIDPGKQMDGVNLTERRYRSSELVENYGIVLLDNPVKQRGIRTDRFKYIGYGSAKSGELYDLVSDPEEKQNISDRSTSLMDELNSLANEGFKQADSRQKISEKDISAATAEKLRSLGYTID